MTDAGNVPKKRRFNAFVLNKQKYQVGDGAMISPSEPDAAPYIGQILKIEAEPNDNRNVVLTLKWYYRPEETALGRYKWQGEYELLTSDHLDECHVGTVVGPVRIVTFDEYLTLTDVDDDTYYTRQHYDVPTKKLKPKLSVFCTCKQPQNPDRVMIQCDACDKWYHDTCIKASDEDKAADVWRCPKCTASNKSAKKK